MYSWTYFYASFKHRIAIYRQWPGKIGDQILADFRGMYDMGCEL